MNDASRLPLPNIATRRPLHSGGYTRASHQVLKNLSITSQESTHPEVAPVHSPKARAQGYEFGNFRLDLIERCLLRDGKPVPLPAKVFETLRVLVEHGGRLATKERMMEEVWAGTFVEDSNLSQNIFTLRKLLGEGEGGQQFIETVPRRGYRFVADVHELREEGLTKRYTDHAEAYNLYLKGRFFWNKRTEVGLKKALEYFQRTLELDPIYALAYVGLADCYIMLCEYGLLTSEESNRRGKAAAIKALELDESLGEAHASLGLVTMLYDWDFAKAEKEFKRAIELNPNYATAHQWYAVHLAVAGRFDEAFSQIRHAQELDPLSPIIGVNVARIHYFARQYDEALRCCRTILETDPTFGVAYKIMGLAYEQKGMYEEGLAALQQALDLLGEAPEMIGFLAHAYAISGDCEEAHKLLKQLQELAEVRRVRNLPLVLAYTGLGELDQVFDCLEKAQRERCDSLPYLKVMPLFDCLRSDPRFTDLMRRAGLAPS
ncbi:MAG TPA: winged helix-turn-helix domain-containing protein [Pyrinomonadaceae bacterium]|nr:winged helix-turn-helix domain-containing protein [Pyrinomonadaceae bacterium]